MKGPCFWTIGASSALPFSPPPPAALVVVRGARSNAPAPKKFNRHVALGVATGVGVGVGAGVLLSQQNRDRRLQQLLKERSLAGTLADHPAATFGLPQTQMLREHEGFIAAFDGPTRNPAWVIEHVTRDKMYGEADRGNSMFYEDEALDERLRNRLTDFRLSGYDRGHLAPAANHKGHQNSMNETFCLSNVSPQVGEGFNRDYWARFEKFVKDAAKRADGLYVVTGPLFLPRPVEDEQEEEDGGDNATKRATTKWRANHAYIGTPPNLVAVPTHFFKVVLAANESGEHGGHKAAVGAFVMPNAAIDPKMPLESFVVPLDALERVAGTTFFPGFVDAARRAALDRTALALQERGRRGAAALPASSPSLLASSASSSSSLLDLDRRQTSLADEEGGDGGGGGGNGDSSKQQQQQEAAPRTSGGRGAVHICEHIACKLPQEKWWLEGKQQQQKKRPTIQRGARAGSAPPP